MSRLTLLSLSVCIAVYSWSRQASAGDLLAGVAVADITPPASYRMSGYFSERLSTGTHDPLLAKAVVFQQGEERAALVFCDLIGISREISTKARNLASERTGIPVANILIAATHSHTGPLYFGALRKHFHDLAVAKHGKDPQEEVDYPAELVKKLADVVVRAQASTRPVRLSAGVGSEKGLSFNRRFHMKDGTVVFNPGKLNPNIVRPAGPRTGHGLRSRSSLCTWTRSEARSTPPTTRTTYKNLYANRSATSSSPCSGPALAGTSTISTFRTIDRRRGTKKPNGSAGHWPERSTTVCRSSSRFRRRFWRFEARRSRRRFNGTALNRSPRPARTCTRSAPASCPS
ncbi:MAG: neutral/alkaline non-lysosomal ceramidase N-terminal domain-containing protein [Planctomycetes bacterium]|nr:neutral/alkaline non-lysosomal ceramidase N-terminal domain-containing protein [Planctomycetota bacterium]